jgi:excisionase family DNA binding protein
MSSTFTIREVCERYGVTATTVRAWVRSGALLALNVSRATTSRKPRWRITQSALDAFELSRTPTPAPPRVAGRRKRQGAVIEFY